MNNKDECQQKEIGPVLSSDDHWGLIPQMAVFIYNLQGQSSLQEAKREQG